MVEMDGLVAFLARLETAERRGATARVFLAAISQAEYESGEILAKPPALARVARVPEVAVRRALSQLVELEALQRIGRGRYKLNPALAFRGSVMRAKAEVLRFKVVDGGAQPEPRA